MARVRLRLGRVNCFHPKGGSLPETQTSQLDSPEIGAMNKRLVYICDWLPPDFGAVGQYAMLGAREWASDGWTVTLIGLTSGRSRQEAAEPVGKGSLEFIRVRRRTYQKQR